MQTQTTQTTQKNGNGTQIIAPQTEQQTAPQPIQKGQPVNGAEQKTATAEEKKPLAPQPQTGAQLPQNGSSLPNRAPQPPAMALPKKLTDAGFATILLSPKRAFVNSGGTETQYNKEINFAVQALMNNDYLFNCAKQYPDHFIEAIKNVALTGLTLNPGLQLAYLVPYKGKVKFQSSYMGKREILTRTGVVQKIEANLVYEKDTFKVIKGLNEQLIHEPDYFNENRGEIRGGYYIATLTNGHVVFDVMPINRINEIKLRSESVKADKGSPWDTDFPEMARKTIINWAFKSLPKTNISDSMIRAIEAESEFEREEFEDWKKAQSRQDKFDEDGISDAIIVS